MRGCPERGGLSLFLVSDRAAQQVQYTLLVPDFANGAANPIRIIPCPTILFAFILDCDTLIIGLDPIRGSKRAFDGR